MKSRDITVQVGLTIRYMLYWIPALVVVSGLYRLAWFWPSSFDPEQGLIQLGFGGVFVAMCEYFVFGLKVAYNDHELIYRYRGWPFPREKRVERKLIRHAKYESAIRTDNKPWRFVELHIEGSDGPDMMRINLTGFARREVEALLRWIPSVER